MDKMREYVTKVQELEAAAKVLDRWQLPFFMSVELSAMHRNSCRIT
jgi:hypothetical protein